MAIERLTQERAERAKPGEFLCDDRVTGLILIAQKRVKTWVCQREVKNPETGIRKTARKKLGHFPAVSVQEARDLAKDQLRKMELGQNPHAARKPNLTVRAAIEEYLKGATDLRPRTIQGYRYHLDHYLDPTPDARRKMADANRKVTWTVIGHLPLSEIGNKPTLVRNVHLELTKACGKATANGVMRTLSASYNGMLALAMELPPNPVTREGVIRWHRLKRRDRRIGEDGFEAWGEALITVSNPIRRAMRLFMLLTGQRDEATRSMRWADVDFKRERIHFPSPKGGEDAAFDLPMSPQVKTVLEFVRTFSTEEWAFPGSEFVWPAHTRTGHVSESKEQRRAELLNPHALRRTFISVGYEVAPNKYVSFIANHACKDSITDQYFEPTLESVRRVLETVDKAIMEKIGADLTTLLGKKEIVSTRFSSNGNEQEQSAS
ncbi:MAG: integrase family protein [Bryobacteraceae bacterium]|nr:integrase family protein [Bryobacteraceae bacterium]